MRAHVSDHDFELLSAYIDGQLSAGETHRLEDHLKTRPELRETLEDLQRTRALLRAAPRMRAPRSFVLSAAAAENARPRRSPLFQNLFPGLSFASALATLALVATLALNLSPGTSSMTVPEMSSAADTAMAPAAEPREAEQPAVEEGELMAQGAAPAELPTGSAPGIQWSDPNNPQVTKDLGSYAQAPQAWGMGGGGGDTQFGMGGAGSLSAPYYVPLEAVESLDPQPGAAEVPVLPESAPEFANGGPIVGIPPADQQGQIIVQSAWGAPLDAASTPSLTNPQPDPADGQPVATAPRAGLSSLLWIQIALAALALATGLGAFLVHRWRAH